MKETNFEEQMKNIGKILDIDSINWSNRKKNEMRKFFKEWLFIAVENLSLNNKRG